MARTRTTYAQRQAKRDRARYRLPLLVNAAGLAPGGALLCWVATLAFAAGPGPAWAPLAFAVAVVALFGMGAACVIGAALSVWSARP